ncbi:MAG: peptide chain release factor N(5)-glutamine methyltransferase [Sutterellaceae bacterium]|nr:peptide chain release factor N(5)-glutamine methyltransferase [Burkholderiaceae bacterium]MCX7901566.1 peptide chain release factor N(5)-glutamine methyltransferase [Burkholderiaceae bacterium]MDW8430574.1 peptide chain release factor N(5)-glutamine methyltransferase [Sutterellaceae bacterium]
MAIEAAALLAAAGLPRREARALLAHVLAVPREALIADPQRPVPTAAAARFAQLAQRRRAGEPLAYLLGYCEFYGRPFAVNAAVLVPRPETETLVQLALARLRQMAAPWVLDLGTGSGCVAVTLALECAAATVLASDVSSAALAVARANAHRLGAQVAFFQGDWLAAVRGPFDLIVSNPPYVAAGDPHLAALRFEPAAALIGGDDGLAALRAIIKAAPSSLRSGGWLLVEHGYDQAAAVRALLRGAGFGAITTTRDAAGIERVTSAQAG